MAKASAALFVHVTINKREIKKENVSTFLSNISYFTNFIVRFLVTRAIFPFFANDVSTIPRIAIVTKEGDSFDRLSCIHVYNLLQ